jgi:hypothetical protein
MSKFVKVQTQLRDLPYIKRALDDLQLAYAENQRYRHVWSGFEGPVPLLVKHPQATFAFRTTAEGGYEVVGDDMQMVQIRTLLDRVQQRYAYHRVLAEVEQAGFALVDEQVGRDKVIRLTVRRWAE